MGSKWSLLLRTEGPMSLLPAVASTCRSRRDRIATYNGTLSPSAVTLDFMSAISSKLDAIRRRTSGAYDRHPRIAYAVQFRMAFGLSALCLAPMVFCLAEAWAARSSKQYLTRKRQRTVGETCQSGCRSEEKESL